MGSWGTSLGCAMNAEHCANGDACVGGAGNWKAAEACKSAMQGVEEDVLAHLKIVGSPVIRLTTIVVIRGRGGR